MLNDASMCVCVCVVLHSQNPHADATKDEWDEEEEKRCLRFFFALIAIFPGFFSLSPKKKEIHKTMKCRPSDN